jgi:hypothetical protein
MFCPPALLYRSTLQKKLQGGGGSGRDWWFFCRLLLNLSLTKSVYQGRAPQPARVPAMLQTDYEAAIARYLQTKGVTRCPTVCAVPTQATVGDSDRAAYRDYVAAKEAARLQRAKSLRTPISPRPFSVD